MLSLIKSLITKCCGKIICAKQTINIYKIALNEKLTVQNIENIKILTLIYTFLGKCLIIMTRLLNVYFSHYK